MKKFFTTFLSLIFLVSILSSQVQFNSDIEFAHEILDNREEFYFYFEIDNISDIIELSSILSIDKKDGNIVYAYATPEQFEEFLTYNLEFNPVEDYYNPAKAITMATTVAQMANWDRYPTHAVYVQMMNDFVTNYPDLCELEVIGQSVNGYDLLSLKISDNVSTDEDEPEFFWSNTMHGDELASYVLSLRFADYLLSNYGTDSQVTNLVNEIEIYINPLANPDGTFYGSATYTNVANSRRNNANNIDLNRNFPTLDGSGYTLQPEISAMMNYADSHNFVMSANTHAGSELMNYPWDTWTSNARAHADDNWWYYVSWIYANLAQANSPYGYFDNESGVTNGGDWYVITGSRQDYMNYYHYCREVTIELTLTKKVDSEDLPDYWNYNRQAMLDYTEQVIYGFRGVVTDACTGTPLDGVKVEIADHDTFNSEVYTSAPVGNYHRPIYEGTYEVTYSLDGYQSQTHTITVVNNETVRLDIELVPDNVASPEFSANQVQIYEGESVDFTDATVGSVTGYSWVFDGGDPLSSNQSNPSGITYNTAGTYDVTLEVNSNGCLISETKENYIEVFEAIAPVADFTADITTVEVGGTVNFTDLSQNIPTSWEWTFDGGTPSTSDQQNPSVTFNSAGVYSVSLTAENAFGSDIETKADYIIVVLDYCDAGSLNDTYMYVADFELNTISNPSGAASYTDFTSISTDILPGQTYNFLVNAGNAYDYNQCIIWADWNIDGVFEDAGELVYQSATENALEYNGTINVPSNASIGQTRIRVRIHYNRDGYNPNTTPCGNSGYGEVEDYTLYLISPEMPPTANFTADVTSTCTGIVQFTDLSALADTWEWDFGDGNTSNEQNPQHTYTADGTYTVSLTVYNAYGNDTHAETNLITVDMP
ncbi:MAG: M14 family zinc carboxypeptidase, partial [Bacteroidales bacterium]|nr:M14 family zinc carboxypeptidase [Bacteroidales bacterium]